MIQWELRAVAPSVAEVVEALREAADQVEAGRRRRRLRWPPRDLDGVLRRFAAEPEGRAHWLGSFTAPREARPAVAVVWWRDHVGRAHVRVVGGQPLLRGAEVPFFEAGWPPLCLLYPEPTLARPGAAWALCACGAWGEPASLGWMGDRCGPCHDRGADAPVSPAAGWPLPPECDATRGADLAPDGSALALRSHTGDIALLDPRTGARLGAVPASPPSADSSLPSTLRAAPGGRFVGLGCLEEEGWRLVVWDAVAGRAVASWAVSGSHCAFAPDGRTLYTESATLEALACPLPAGPCRALPGLGPVAALAVRPDGAVLAALDGRRTAVVLWDTVADGVRSRVALPSPAQSSPAFAPDGRLLVLLDGGTVLHDVERGVTAARLPSGVALEAAQFTPDGRGLLLEGLYRWQAWALPRAEGGQATPLFERQRAFPRDAFVLPDGRLLTLSRAEGRARLWPAEVFDAET